MELVNSTRNKGNNSNCKSMSRSRSMSLLSFSSKSKYKKNRDYSLTDRKPNSSRFDFRCFIQEMNRLDDEEDSSWITNSSSCLDIQGEKKYHITNAEELC